jgi:hypothetical protein
MTEHSPITPPPELIAGWIEIAKREPRKCPPNPNVLCTLAAQWGADHQLKADAKWLDQNSLNTPHLTITPIGKRLVEKMRPKPPSLKEQALQELDKVDMLWATEEFGQETLNSLDTIRRAIASIPDPS